MRYQIDYFNSVKRYVVCLYNRHGFLKVIAGYATRRQAQAKLKELKNG